MLTAADVKHLQTDIHILNTLTGFSENLYLMQTTLIITSNSQIMLTVSTETETMAVHSPACHLLCIWYLDIYNASVSTRVVSELMVYWCVFHYNMLDLFQFPSKIFVDLHRPFWKVELNVVLRWLLWDDLHFEYHGCSPWLQKLKIHSWWNQSTKTNSCKCCTNIKLHLQYLELER